jgi:hypothetical protein
MANIGLQTCTFVRGIIPVPKLRNMKWEVPGLNGYGLAILGYGDTQFRLAAVVYGTLTSCHAAAIALEQMQGTIVAVATDLGQSSNSIFLESVGGPEIGPWRIPGTNVTHRLEIEIKAVLV